MGDGQAMPTWRQRRDLDCERRSMNIRKWNISAPAS
jgi:hypothetical protein